MQDSRAAVAEGGLQAAGKAPKRGGSRASADAGGDIMLSMHGVMRLSMHGAWDLQLAADTSARNQLTEVCALECPPAGYP